jgi:flagellar hook assembly protein FlgD
MSNVVKVTVSLGNGKELEVSNVRHDGAFLKGNMVQVGEYTVDSYDLERALASVGCGRTGNKGNGIFNDLKAGDNW